MEVPGGLLKCPEKASSLLYDTACLQVQNTANHSIDLYSVSSECIKCDASLWTSLPPQSNASLVVSAKHSIFLSAVGNKTICQQWITFAEHEVALWNVEEDNCTFSIAEPGQDAYFPLYMFMGVFEGLLLLFLLCRTLSSLPCSRRLRSRFTRNSISTDIENDLGDPTSSSDSVALVQSELVPLQRMDKPRILALDTFRGITISLMIFVNYGGGKYGIFEHSSWNGLTVADLVFPWFAWLMGVSMALSYRSKLRMFSTRTWILLVAWRRALLLILLGVVINNFNSNDLSTIRFCGVLQRLGLAYFIVSTLEMLFMKKQPRFQRGGWMPLLELMDSWRQWVVIAALVAVQVSVSLYLVVPGCPTGYLGPGGAYNHSATPNCTGGAARHIDSLVFHDAHLYQKSPVRKVYHTLVPFDPEGLLGTLTTCLTVYLGVQAGYILLNYDSTVQRSSRWIFWAALTGLSAGILCDWSLQGGLIPVNKQLWSLSFALLTSAFAFLLLAALFVLVDHLHWWKGGEFRLAGMNAILLYLGHIVTKNTFPWSWKPHDLTDHTEVLTMNIYAVVLWLMIARLLHWLEIFLTI